MRKSSPSVSIIIPCKKIDAYVRECVEHCKRLDYGDYEIIVLPDRASKELDGSKIVATGPVTPGAKRNIGLANSGGEICAFIDSDAYPRRDWLKNAVKYFNDAKVAAVGGPGLTPERDSPAQKGSGYVLSSFMVGGISSRYKAKQCFESDDVHSCNFIMRKSLLEQVGGWNEKYWPGEDTLICLAIRNAGMKIVEAPDVVIYHHRRPLFKEHLKQVSRFGMHRGFFAKRFGGNSLHLMYFLPSIVLIIFAIVAVSSAFISIMAYSLVVLVSSYLVISFLATILETRERRFILHVWGGILLTHITYGVYFIVGMLKRDLKR